MSEAKSSATTYTNYGVNFQDAFSNYDSTSPGDTDCLFIILNGTGVDFTLSGWSKSGQYNHKDGSYTAIVPARTYLTNNSDIPFYNARLTQLPFNSLGHGTDNINILTQLNQNPTPANSIIMGIQCSGSARTTRILTIPPKKIGTPEDMYGTLQSDGTQTAADQLLDQTVAGYRIRLITRDQRKPGHTLMLISPTDATTDLSFNVSTTLNNEKI